MVCRNCGKNIEGNMQFCGNCGAKIDVNMASVMQNGYQGNTNSNNANRPVQKPQNTNQYNVNQRNMNQYNVNMNQNQNLQQSQVANNSNKKSGSTAKVVAIICAVMFSLLLIVVGVGFALLNHFDVDVEDLSSDGFAVFEEIADSEKDEKDAKDEKKDKDKTDKDDEKDSELMPSCVGWEYDDVKDYFDSIDCVIRYEYEYDSKVPEDCVISQSIEEDEELIPGEKIVFVISLGAAECPEEYSQKIVVTGKRGSSSANMEVFTWDGGEWVSNYRCSATVGKNGIGSNYGEGKGVTPEGVYKLGVLLTAGRNPNSTWPHKRVTTDTGIVDDVTSVYYNTIVDISTMSPHTSCDPIGDTIINGNTDKCMYIEHNGNGIDTSGVVVGNGSAITICGKTGTLYATAGCVDIAASDFNSILNILDYNLNPHIVIEVE